MISCNRIQRLIDEAEHIGSLSFEASNHLDSCDACRAFANERMRLREMLGTLPSITVPANFNGQLKARLEAAKARQSFAWFSPAVYLRYGTATAVLVVAVFAAQYAGVFTGTEPVQNTNIAANSGSSEIQPITPRPTVNPPLPYPPQPSGVIVDRGSKAINVAPQPISSNRRINRTTPRRSVEVADEFDMPDSSVRPFSVGAQDRIYMRADSATPVRTVSF